MTTEQLAEYLVNSDILSSMIHYDIKFVKEFLAEEFPGISFFDGQVAEAVVLANQDRYVKGFAAHLSAV